MTPSAKKSKSSWLLYLLIGVLLAIGVCTAIIIYLTLLRSPNSGPDVEKDFQNGTTTTTTTTTIGSVVNEETTTMSTTTTATTATTTTMLTSSSSSSSSTSMTTLSTISEATSTMPTTTPTTTEAVEISIPVDVTELLKDQDRKFQIIEKCSKIEALVVNCDSSPSSSSSSSELRPDMFEPLHYSLNLTIRDIRKPVIEGFSAIYAKALVKTMGVALNAVKIHNIDNRDRIRIVNCDTGETICVSRAINQPESSTLLIETAQSIEPSTHLRIDINGFISADGGPHIFKQISTSKWRVPAMLGTVFEPSTSRLLFPSFDNQKQKSTFSLCLGHSPEMFAISNSPPHIESTGSAARSCFERTVPLTSQQFSFVAYEMTLKQFYNSTVFDGVRLPEIELIFNMKRQQNSEWIYNETIQVIKLLSKWTSFEYPLKRLSIVIAPIVTGHTSLGIVALPAQAVAYQKHTLTHETLMKEVIGQWMEGIVTTQNTCFEKALINYLEWKISEETQIVKKTRKFEIGKIRPRNLNETNDQLRVIRDVKTSSSVVCSPRFTEVFYTLDETFGSDAVVSIIKVIFQKFAFSIATIDDWQNAAQVATGRKEAAQMIGEWFSRELSRPVLRAFVRSSSVEFEQLTNETWTVPLEIAGSSGSELIVIDQAIQSIPFISNDYVVVDPNRKSNAFVVYDADTYLRLIRCYGDVNRCPSKEIGAAFSDLGAALVANLLSKPNNEDIPKWKSVFKFMAQQNLVEGTAACCVEHAIREMRKCSYWDIQDVCTKIHFNTILAAIA